MQRRPAAFLKIDTMLSDIRWLSTKLRTPWNSI